MLFFWTFLESLKKKNKQHNCFQNRNVSWAANQHIRGSCDTEDWSNDAENTALITEINYILTDIHIEDTYFKL